MRYGMRARVLALLLGFGLLIALALLALRHHYDEYTEARIAEALLGLALEHHLARPAAIPPAPAAPASPVRMFDGERLPAALAALPPGIHDDIHVDGVEYLLLVRDHDGRRWHLGYDIRELETLEAGVMARFLASALLIIAVLCALLAWRLGRLLHPLDSLAHDIRALAPAQPGQRVRNDPRAAPEIRLIAEACNEFIERSERHVAREHAFIHSVSHELRTPLAVIGGAAHNARALPTDSDALARQLAVIADTTADMHQLVELLLSLARDPQRLRRDAEPVELAALLPRLVEHHRHLLHDKELTVVLDAPTPCTVHAPPAIVQAALGNLLRNAIEHSDRGSLRLSLDAATATVTVDDPGHGMSAAEISALYRRQLRSASRGGIGLDLIQRLCVHLGWQLHIEARPGGGTRATLCLATDDHDTALD